MYAKSAAPTLDVTDTMFRSMQLTGCGVCALVVISIAGAQEVQYTLMFPKAKHHEAEIEARFPAAPDPLQLRMSRTSPGRYAAQDFTRNVYNVRITDGESRPLPVTRPNALEWHVKGHKGTVVVRYTLFGDTASGTYAAINSTSAVLNAPAVFLWARGMTNRPAVVAIHPPKESPWKIATQLEPLPNGTFRAPHLEYLLDSPILAGDIRFEEWTQGNGRIRMALHQGSEREAAAVAGVIRAASREVETVFGELPQFDFGSYTFLLHFTRKSEFDAMEHRNSTMVTSPDPIRSFRGDGSTTHEFMHAWNVERIRPRSLEPFNFEEPSVSAELWFGEGFTSYYDQLISHRAGLISVDRFTAGLGTLLSGFLNSPGRQLYSAVEMSERSSFSDGALRPPEPAGLSFDNFRNTFVSHYGFGNALALGIDLSIRSEFPGKSLDDWMRATWVTYGRPQRNYSPEKPYTVEDLQRTLASVTSAAFAARIFDDHIRGRIAMPYESLLNRAGLLLRPSAPDKVWFDRAGLRFDKDGMELTRFPLTGTLLYEAGLDRGDRITEIGNLREFSASAFDAWLDKQKPGERVKAKVSGLAGDRQLELVLPKDPRLEVVTFERIGRAVTHAQLDFRRSWLGSKVTGSNGGPAVMMHCSKCRRALQFDYEKCPFDGEELGIVPPAP